MPDQSAPRGILASSNLFSAIEMEVGPTAGSVVIVEPDACAPGVPATAVTAARAREIVRGDEQHDPLPGAIWAALVRQTMMQPRSWQRIAIWTALPGLHAIVNRLHRVWRTDRDDLRSEVVLGFLEALRQADPEQPHLGSRLWWNTYRLARQMCRQAVGERAVEDIELLAGRRAEPDDGASTPAPPIGLGPHAAQAVESARLGSLASRLGLRAVVNDRPVDGENAVIFLPRAGTMRPPNLGTIRGNGPGEAG